MADQAVLLLRKQLAGNSHGAVCLCAHHCLAATRLALGGVSQSLPRCLVIGRLSIGAAVWGTVHGALYPRPCVTP